MLIVKLLAAVIFTGALLTILEGAGVPGAWWIGLVAFIISCGVVTA